MIANSIATALIQAEQALQPAKIDFGIGNLLGEQKVDFPLKL